MNKVSRDDDGRLLGLSLSNLEDRHPKPTATHLDLLPEYTRKKVTRPAGGTYFKY